MCAKASQELSCRGSGQGSSGRGWSLGRPGYRPVKICSGTISGYETLSEIHRMSSPHMTIAHGMYGVRVCIRRLRENQSSASSMKQSGMSPCRSSSKGHGNQDAKATWEEWVSNPRRLPPWQSWAREARFGTRPDGDHWQSCSSFARFPQTSSAGPAIATSKQHRHISSGPAGGCGNKRRHNEYYNI